MSKVTIAFVLNKNVQADHKSLKSLIEELKKNYKANVYKELIKFEKIKKANILFIPAPREKFEDKEIEDLKKFVEQGGKLIILSTEGGDVKSNTNLNQFLESYGIKFKNNCVINTNFQKYLHPKELYIGNNSISSMEFFKTFFDIESKRQNNKILSNNLKLIYPSGCEIEVKSPAFSVFNSNLISYPINSTIVAGYQNEKNGKILAFGSYHYFINEYILKEDNLRAFNLLLNFLNHNEVVKMKKNVNIKKRKKHIPDIGQLSENLKCCLQDNSKTSKDVFNLFETNLFKFDFSMVSESLKLYKELGVKNEPLTLINPVFSTPMLGLKPAVFPPVLMDLQHPKLELFDLDDEFADQNTKLAQLTNKSTNSDLSYYITECSNICGLKDKVNCDNPNSVLLHILKEVINFKKSIN